MDGSLTHEILMLSKNVEIKKTYGRKWGQVFTFDIISSWD